MSLRARFLAFDDALAARGVPPCTQWWRDGVGDWLDAYERAQVLELWTCVGRGAAKSTALYKLATFFLLFGDFKVPPGERHFAIVLSRLKEEAAKGVAIIDRWLDLLGVPHHLAGDVIELDDMPRGLRVVAASVAASSGWRAFFVGKDERSKWQSGGVDELDAAEVDTSAAAMTATHPLAPVLSFGSAWGAFGAFYEAIVGGSTDSRIVLGPAPTWIAAPHISEESCRRKERDPRRFAREYASVFQAGSVSAFDPEDVDAAFEPRQGGTPLGPRVVIIDASSGRKDRFSYGICGFVQGARAIVEPAHSEALAPLEDGHEPTEAELLADFATIAEAARDVQATASAGPILRFDLVDGFEPEQARRLGAAGVVSHIARVARKHGATLVHGDQREAYTLASAFRSSGLRFRAHDWTASSKPEAIELVRRWFRERAIALPAHDQLRKELTIFEERIAASGAFTFGARGNGHDDYVSLLITSALAQLGGGLRGGAPRLPGIPGGRSHGSLTTYDSQLNW